MYVLYVLVEITNLFIYLFNQQSEFTIILLANVLT
jgi:hypothetical protein